MDKVTKTMFIIWAVLAVAAFVAAFFASPFWVKLLGWVFGLDNLILIFSYLVGMYQERKLNKKLEG